MIAAVALGTGEAWYWPALALCGAAFIAIGQRRIFRPGITRTAGEIACRYVPWYEGNSYYAFVVFPVLGVSATAAGFTQGNPAWLRFAGLVLVAVGLFMMYSAIRMRRRSLLCITPTLLRVRQVCPKGVFTEIPRETIQSIDPKMVSTSANAEALHAEITYCPTESKDGNTSTVDLGLQLTVEPGHLLNALIAWKDADPQQNSEQLLDRVERILRGQDTAVGC